MHMRKSIVILLLLCCLPSANAATYPVQAEVFFSPQGGTADEVIRQIDQAHRTIRVQAYSFTHASIAKALVEAEKRGVDVQVILDRSNRTGKYSAADFTSHGGVPTYIDAAHPIAHNKIMILDGETVITGSFNFTKQADEKNAENLLILHSKDLAATYLENWQSHKAHSDEYVGR
ncbi:MAG: phospholipase D/Transphosphatidylase [Rhodocyclales bacterium]|nr:phospholipase D/Transphosphatidylase [Rhodocyclales bacterium]